MSRLLSAGAVLALALLLPCGAALAQVAGPGFVPAAPFPGDRIGVPTGIPRGTAPLRLDAAVTPELVLREVIAAPVGQAGPTVYVHELHYTLEPETGPVFLEPPLFYSYVDVEVLSVGVHRIAVIGTFNGNTVFEAEWEPLVVSQREVPGNDISGWWYQPAQDGRGVFVTAIAPDTGPSLYSFLWATHDAAGRESWTLMVDAEAEVADEGLLFDGPAVLTRGAPPSSGNVDLQSVHWGNLAFRYLGCGRAVLSWDAADPAISDGEMALQQLAQPLGTTRCLPPAGSFVGVQRDATGG